MEVKLITIQKATAGLNQAHKSVIVTLFSNITF